MALYSRCAGEGGRSPPRLYNTFRMRGVAHGLQHQAEKKTRPCRFPRCRSTLRSLAIDLAGARRPSLQSEICVPQLVEQSTEMQIMRPNYAESIRAHGIVLEEVFGYACANLQNPCVYKQAMADLLFFPGKIWIHRCLDCF